MPAVRSKTLLTDLYQLTMNAAYYYSGKDDVATYDYYLRDLPPDWGYFIANGIEDALDYLTSIAFSSSDIRYLKKQGFKKDFLDFLGRFRFEGDVLAVREATPVFPAEPVLRVTARRTQAQYVETSLLNILNFQTMIATKAARVVLAAGGASVVDFGLRRAHEEDAGVKGARAAYIAGAEATSNVKAGKTYGIPVAGTHAHSFIMSFPSELEAFRAYVKVFPRSTTLLIDTYDTLEGARNACIVARELERSGNRLGGVRIDSGDLGKSAKEVRRILDAEGLAYVNIIASSDLNEYRIEELVRQKAPIDMYGVGTELITAKPAAAIPGVYKLADDIQGPKIKLSQGKETLPGRKQVFRQADSSGTMAEDFIALEQEAVPGVPLLEAAIRRGKRIRRKEPLKTIRSYCRQSLARLPGYSRCVHAKRRYPVGIGRELSSLVCALKKEHQKN